MASAMRSAASRSDDGPGDARGLRRRRAVGLEQRRRDVVADQQRLHGRGDQRPQHRQRQARQRRGAGHDEAAALRVGFDRHHAERLDDVARQAARRRADARRIDRHQVAGARLRRQRRAADRAGWMRAHRHELGAEPAAAERPAASTPRRASPS